MPNIKISEQDLTRPGERAVNRNIVYIPGFPGYGEPEVIVDIPTFLRYQVTQRESVQTIFPDDGTTMFYTSDGWKYIPAEFPSESVSSPAITTMGTNTGDNGITVDGDIEVYTPSVSATFTLDLVTETGAGKLKIGNYTIDIPFSEGFSGTAATPITIIPRIPISAFPSSIDMGSQNTINDLISIGSNKTFGLNSAGEYTSILNALRNTITKDYYYFNISANGVVSTINLGENSFKYNDNLPYLCEDIETFEEVFGSKPFRFSTAYKGICNINIGDYDKSWVMAEELINRGLPVLYHVPYTPNGTETGTDDLIDAFQSALKNGDKGIELLRSKSDYDVKYITTGAYPSAKLYGTGANYSLATQILEICKGPGVNTTAEESMDLGRGDCYALIDHEEDIPLANYAKTATAGYILDKVAEISTDNINDEYGTVFTPWFHYNASYANTYGILRTKGAVGYETTYNSGEYSMPASFAYLCSLAESVKNNPNWYAVAGVSRGIVPGFVKENIEINNTIANQLQLRAGVTSINSITYIRPYGYAIWGNRTMKNNAGEGNLTATSFLNVRNMLCDIKKVVREQAMKLIFEQDTTALWVNFLAGITPTLEQMRGTGLSNYKIIREKTTEKAKMKATIRIYPIYSLEDVEINIELRDEDVTVE